MSVRDFAHFIAIDWSGARGARHKAIAMAVADAAGGPPVLVRRQRGWSRAEILEVLTDGLPANSLVGLDLGIALPFADRGAYFPDWDQSPPDARALWSLVDEMCAEDDHLCAGGFVDHPQASAYFRRHGAREGARFAPEGQTGGRGRFRVTERAQEAIGCKPYSNFNLVGAAQVGKSSLTGMRVLHRLGGRVPVWPIDPLPGEGSVVVEIYTTIAAIAAGRTASRSKMRDFAELNAALANLGSPPVAGDGAIDDHASDALLTAAWLRVAAHDPAMWLPAGLTPEIARTEGWTFGVA
ncbi:hypothetical protein GRI62_02700 [Erythrobacter arachoides]|uniref:DUF429 domain-containing protein n=1 Tax=Aurantiacibacter arachoides TaxID=1850444 RepID=A0A844ZYH4_9SPHN|nr:hypothetical protein [Aurantiacibacter arachoides]MXO92514.1 hypothetical protein [Aurantiacibacter arachoides]GGD56573.1 hypothetical protein GCM10011411_15750 [Aurantiacibacter arachoides]